MNDDSAAQNIIEKYVDKKEDFYIGPHLWGARFWSVLHCWSLSIDVTDIDALKRFKKVYTKFLSGVLPCHACRYNHAISVILDPIDSLEGLLQKKKTITQKRIQLIHCIIYSRLGVDLYNLKSTRGSIKKINVLFFDYCGISELLPENVTFEDYKNDILKNRIIARFDSQLLSVSKPFYPSRLYYNDTMFMIHTLAFCCPVERMNNREFEVKCLHEVITSVVHFLPHDISELVQKILNKAARSYNYALNLNRTQSFVESILRSLSCRKKIITLMYVIHRNIRQVASECFSTSMAFCLCLMQNSRISYLQAQRNLWLTPCKIRIGIDRVKYSLDLHMRRYTEFLFADRNDTTTLKWNCNDPMLYTKKENLQNERHELIALLQRMLFILKTCFTKNGNLHLEKIHRKVRSNLNFVTNFIRKIRHNILVPDLKEFSYALLRAEFCDAFDVHKQFDMQFASVFPNYSNISVINKQDIQLDSHRCIAVDFATHDRCLRESITPSKSGSSVYIRSFCPFHAKIAFFYDLMQMIPGKFLSIYEKYQRLQNDVSTGNTKYKNMTMFPNFRDKSKELLILQMNLLALKYIMQNTIHIFYNLIFPSYRKYVKIVALSLLKKLQSVKFEISINDIHKQIRRIQLIEFEYQQFSNSSRYLHNDNQIILLLSHFSCTQKKAVIKAYSEKDNKHYISVVDWQNIMVSNSKQSYEQEVKNFYA